MPFKLNIKPPVRVAAGVILFACILQLLRPDQIERLERISYDSRIKEAAKYRHTVATNLGFAMIGDDSIKRVNDGSLGYRFGLYWPRQVYARMARELYTQGAKAVAFDVLFDGLRYDQGNVFLTDGTNVTSDEFLARIMRHTTNVILATDGKVLPARLFMTNAMALGDIKPEKDKFDGFLRTAQTFRPFPKWHPAFLKMQADPELQVDLGLAQFQPGKIVLPRAEELGDITIPIDAENRFNLEDLVDVSRTPADQRHPKAFTEGRIWHMGILLAATALDLDLDRARIELSKGRITLPGKNGMERVIPVDSKGRFYIPWAMRWNDRHLAQDFIEHLLENDKDRADGNPTHWDSRFTNRIVIVGSVATGNDLTDLGATPLEPVTYLVSSHWNVANAIITDYFIHRPGLGIELFLICGFGALASYGTRKLKPTIASLTMILGVLGLWLVAFIVFVEYQYWIPLVLPTVSILTAYAGQLVYTVLFEQNEKRRVRGLFSKIVSPHIVNELLGMDRLRLDGTRRIVTVMFSDIRGFTELTDRNRELAAEYIKEHNLTGEEAQAVVEQSASDTLDTVNRYLSVVAEQVIKNDGTVDKFIGDCVMAFWGAPVDNPLHAVCSVKAALGAQRAVHDLNREREAKNREIQAENQALAAEGRPLKSLYPTLSVGTGLNTGTVTVGLMGWRDHLMNYTVFGREVNIASRLEGVSGRGRVIISEATLTCILAVDPELGQSCVKLPAVHVKGIRDDVEIYEVPWRTGNYAPTEEELALLKPKPDGTETILLKRVSELMKQESAKAENSKE